MRGRQRVLIVDDERYVRDSLAEIVADLGVEVVTAASAVEARRVLAERPVDTVLTDLRMPGEDGFEFLKSQVTAAPEIPVVVITGHGSVDDAVAAMKAGAYDFIQKPADPEQLELVLRRAFEHRSLTSEVATLRHAMQDLRGERALAGSSAAMTRVRELIAQVAPTDATVLVTGESGTGKELVANEIHRLGTRAERALVRVNCAAVPETLFESEFFGHRRGSFSGAIADRRGRFAEAEGGTLVLDEIGTLQPEMQAKLLRVLETGEYQVVGESSTQVADVRIVAITNEDLSTQVGAGRFRDDLYYRLAIFPIELPPLRAHREDIPEIAVQLLTRTRSGAWSGSREEVRVTDEALEVLASYSWPGNVRELRNVLERALILVGPGRALDAHVFRPLLESSILPAGGARAMDDGAGLTLRPRLDALERELVLRALERTSGKKKEAANLLGIDPRNLGYYLRKHDLKREDGA